MHCLPKYFWLWSLWSGQKEIINIVATWCHILRQKCTKFDFGWGSSTYPARGARSAPQIPSWPHPRSRPSGSWNNLPSQIRIPKSAYDISSSGWPNSTRAHVVPAIVVIHLPVYCVTCYPSCESCIEACYVICTAHNGSHKYIHKKLIRRWDSQRELSLRRHCTRTKNTIDSCINSATDRFLQHRFTKFS